MYNFIIINKSLCPIIDEIAEEDFCKCCEFHIGSGKNSRPDTIICKFSKPGIKENLKRPVNVSLCPGNKV